MMKIILTMVLVLVSSIAFADNGKPYGSAGCGLGSIVMGKSGSQVLAATTNGTSDTQMFGITSGTSNCTDQGHMANRGQVPMFIEANRTALANDMARGHGEALNYVSHAYNCKDNVQFGRVMQKNYGAVFSHENSDSVAISSSIERVIRTNPDLAASCHI